MADRTRVLMILSKGFTHDPRVASEAQGLQRAGYDVTVLCWDREGTLPLEGTQDGVRVVRIRSSVAMRLRGYDIFRLPAMWRRAAQCATELHRASPFAVVHCHDLDTLPAGAMVKRQVGVRLVYDAHEAFPYLLEMTPARRFARRYELLERRLAPEVDLVITVSPPLRDYLAAFVRAPIVIVANAKPLPSEAWVPPRTGRMTVLYLGGLDPTRFVVPLIELAIEDPFFDVEIGGMGPLSERIRGLAATSKGNVGYLGTLPMEAVLPKTRACDIVFALFDPAERLNRIGMPTKFFEALAAGRPILVSRGTYIAQEVEANEVGLALPYTKVGLREALHRLAGDPALRERLGRNTLRLARERYNWPMEEAKLLAAYRAMGVDPR